MHGAGRETAADITFAIGRGDILIESDKRGQLHLPGGFFKRLSNSGLLQRFISLQMARWLIEHDAAVSAFLDKQKPRCGIAGVAQPVRLLNNNGHRFVGLETHGLLLDD